MLILSILWAAFSSSSFGFHSPSVSQSPIFSFTFMSPWTRSPVFSNLYTSMKGTAVSVVSCCHTVHAERLNKIEISVCILSGRYRVKFFYVVISLASLLFCSKLDVVWERGEPYPNERKLAPPESLCIRFSSWHTTENTAKYRGELTF